MSHPWKVELFGCFEDTQITLLGLCCSCYLFGQNAEQIDGSSKIGMCIGYICLTGCCLNCVLHKPRRQTLRTAYNLEEKPSDLVATCLCGPCGLCQEAIELKQRGVVPGGRMTVSNQPR